MKKIFLISALCFLGQISFGQTNVEVQKKAEPSNDPKLEAFKKQHEDVAAKNAESIQAATYSGHNETLKSFFSNGIIPNETPKFDGTLSKEQYIKVLNDWISKNKHLLKPEHKNSFIK